MKKFTPVGLLALLASALALPSLAHAHTGRALVYDCASGLGHPFLGWDHLLAMVAVGVLAAQYGGRARWFLPVAFVAIMSCAAALGAGGFAMPDVESLLAMSVLVLGLLIAAPARLPLAVTAVTVGFFAFAHGIAHGAEIPETSPSFVYGAGFVISTAALHVLGLLVGHLASLRSAELPRLAGVACAAVGAVLVSA